jgi:two-component system, chemotaxis family, chemotaxis protein CheY
MARILVVDDTLVMRINLKKILEESGHQVVGEAPDGQKAITLYEKLKPDLVTLDITMPEMNGIDALQEIKKRDASARVIMISALSQKGKVLQALDLGAKHYIVKPFEKRVIGQVIQSVLQEDGFFEEKSVGEEKVLETPKEAVEGRVKESLKEEDFRFIVQNREGTYVLLPSENKGQWMVVILEKLLQLKKPRVVINILSCQTISSFMFEQLVRAVEKIKGKGGKVEVYANMEVLHMFEGKPGYKMLMGEVNKYF